VRFAVAKLWQLKVDIASVWRMRINALQGILISFVPSAFGRPPLLASA
jgi:hypothetical protein